MSASSLASANGQRRNQQLLRRAIAFNREEDIPVTADSVLFGLSALAQYIEDPEEVYFVKSPKSFLGANGLKPQQLALFEDLVCAMMFHIKRQAESVLAAEISQTVIGRPVNFQGSGGEDANRQAEGIYYVPHNVPVSVISPFSLNPWLRGWISKRH